MVKSAISTFLGRVIGIERKRDFLSHCCQISWKFNSAIVLIPGKVDSLRGARIQIQKSKARIQIWISQAKISITNSQESRYIGNIRKARMHNPQQLKSPMLVVGLSLSNNRIDYKTKWSCLKASGIVLGRKMNWQKWKILLHYCKWSWLWPFQPIKCPPLPITENKLFRPKAF